MILYKANQDILLRQPQWWRRQLTQRREEREAWRGRTVTHVKYLATEQRTVMTMKHFNASKQIHEIMKISESYLCKTNSC